MCVRTRVCACVHTCAGTVREGVGSAAGGDLGKWKGMRKVSLSACVVWILPSRQ